MSKEERAEFEAKMSAMHEALAREQEELMEQESEIVAKACEPTVDEWERGMEGEHFSSVHALKRKRKSQVCAYLYVSPPLLLASLSLSLSLVLSL